MNQNLSGRRRVASVGLRIFGGVLAGLALGAALVWWGVYAFHDRTQAATIEHLQGQLLRTQSELDDLYAQRDVLTGQLAVESSTRKGLEVTLGIVQDELGAARDQMAFFYELLPAGPEGSISIRGLDIQQKGSMLHFRVLLMRHGADGEPFDGMLQFQANGRAAGDLVTVILEPVRVHVPDNGVIDGIVNGDIENSPSTPVLALKFDQFQRSSGLLQIPEGIELEDVTLNVLEGQTVRVSRTINLPVQQLPH